MVINDHGWLLNYINGSFIINGYGWSSMVVDGY